MCKTTDYDYSKLLGLIKEKGLTQEAVAREISRNPCTISQKINNKGVFTAAEIDAIRELLGIAIENVGAYFFTVKVQKLERGIRKGA